MLASSGEPLLMIGKALNQSTQATTEVYAHLAQDTLAEMLERYGSNVVSLAKVKRLKGIS